MRSFLYLCLIFSFSCYAQNKEVDSLIHLLKSVQHDTTKIRIYQYLAEIDNEENLEKYADAQITLIEKQLLVLQKNTKEYAQVSLFKAAYFENMGLVEQNKGNLGKAIDYHFKSLKIRENFNDQKAVGSSLNNIGLVYDALDEADKALTFYEKSYDVCKRSGNNKMSAYALNGIGDILMKKKEYVKALKTYQESYQIKKSVNDKFGMSYSFNNIGVVYKKMLQLDSAVIYFKKSLALREEINDRNGAAYSYINISRTLFVQNKLPESKMYAEKAMLISRELNFPNIIRFSADALQNIYEKQRNFEKAFEMLKISKEMGEVIVNDDVKKELMQKEMQYVYEKKNIADSIKVAEEKKITSLQLKQEENQRYWLYGGLGITLLFGGIMFNRFRLTKKQKNIIEQQKAIVESKQKEVMDSIHYAKRIQQSLLPTERYIARALDQIDQN